MRHGFSNGGVGRFFLSVTAISALGLGIGAFGPGFLAWISTPAQAQDVLVMPSQSDNQSTTQSDFLSAAFSATPTVTPVPPLASVASLPMYKKRLEYRAPPQKPLTELLPIPQKIVVDGLPLPLSSPASTTLQEDRELMAHIETFREIKNKGHSKAELLEGFRVFMKYHPSSEWNASIQANIDALNR